MRLVQNEEDRWESHDHAYSQGLIDGAEQAARRIRDIKDAEAPPQVTVNPEGSSLRGAPVALISLLIGAGLAALFFLARDGGEAPAAPQQPGVTIEQHFGESEPTAPSTPPAASTPEPRQPTDETVDPVPAIVPADDGDSEPIGGESAELVGSETGDDAGPTAVSSSDSARGPVGVGGADVDPPSGTSPDTRPGVPADPEPPGAAEPDPPAANPEPTRGPVRSLVGGVGETLDGTVDGLTDTVDDVVCGLLCPPEG